MLTITQAFEKLLGAVKPGRVVTADLDDVLGLTLCQDVIATQDSPPFDKSLMDGYAIRSSDLVDGAATLKVTEVVTAGQIPQHGVGSGEAIQIMTGAPLPEGADLVAKVEDTQRNGDEVSIKTTATKPGMNLIRRGTSIQSGNVVLRSGTHLNGSRIGALAEMGLRKISVRARPRIAILATGDELVSVAQTPGPGQIRNSNGTMLAAQLKAAGAIPFRLGIARDNRDDLQTKIMQGLQFDMLLLSGGVSAGTLDLVPSTLADAGVEEVFHKVEMKPGKPIWFGVRSNPDASQCCVFGLPGNPVSSLVCCELFVKTAIRQFMGVIPITPRPHFAQLEHGYSTRSDRPTYHPARIEGKPEGLTVALVPWHGSSDLCGTVIANGMVFFDGEPRHYEVGDRLEAYFW